tara:strand:- start:168 stop:623 length:456 start_codon:yes stop_codon:yes gene_type:complete
MDQDLQLFNSLIPQKLIEENLLNNYKQYITPFDHYDSIYKKLQKALTEPSKQTLKIYDYTTGLKASPGKKFPINDHINRIGHNPFIGKQQFFDIDFINIEQLYIQHPTGITTNSCGEKLSSTLPFPSSYLANLAVMGLILKYKIEGYLIHV